MDILKKTFCVISFFLMASLPSVGHTQVVQFRLEATAVDGTPIDSVTVGEDFHLTAYTQHVNGYVSEEFSGVFAGYLDISFDGSMASVTDGIEHSTFYENGKSGDTSTAGIFDNIGGFSSGGELGIGLEPLGLSEYFLFSVPMRADKAGELSFLGSESGSYPAHDVLVYGLDEPIPAKDIDFGAVGTRIDFGAANIRVVPEPGCSALFIPGMIGLFAMYRSTRYRDR